MLLKRLARKTKQRNFLDIFRESVTDEDMKYIIASDIHGSAKYCRALVERFKEEKADKLLLLGDILYHGPRNPLPEEYSCQDVAALLNPMKDRIVAVRGNCDAEVDQMVLEFPCMADYAVLTVKAMAGERTVFVTHGHLFNEENVPPHSNGTILLHGHTHVPVCRAHEDYVYINPGSVSIPKEGSCHSYISLEDGKMEWKDIETGRGYMAYDL